MPETKQRPLLADRQFAALWSTVETSFLGMFIHVVASAWMIANLTNSATLVAMAQTANALPIVLFSLLAGALADTKGQRMMMLMSLALSILASLALVVVAYFEVFEAWLLLLILFFVGVGNAVFIPAWQAALASLVPRARLSEAIAIHNIGANIMRTTGPPLGGLLVASLGPVFTFVAGGLTYLPALITVGMWRPVKAPSSEGQESLSSAMMGGLRYVFSTPQVRPILLRSFAATLTCVSVTALLPMIARDQLGGGATSYGLLFGAFGFGAILGGLTFQALRPRVRTESLVRGCHLVNAAAIVVLVFARSFPVAVLPCILSGGCWLIFNSIHNSSLQLTAPRWLAGRIVAMFFTASFLGLSLGGWIWGFIAQRAGTQTSLALSVVAVLGMYLLARRFPLPETRALIVDPLPQPRMLTEIPQSVSRNDPVQVMITHRVDPAHATTFHRLMFQRRRHLTQLGARHWSLLNALNQDGAWVETFQLASWSDFQRYLSRRTAESQDLRDQLVLIQKDQIPPQITHYVAVTPGPEQKTMMLRS